MRGAWAEFITGTCVLVLAIGFAVVGFQRGGFGASDESYVLNASFRSIEGVTVGTDVRLAGVNVGKVSAISLNPDSFRADMQISLDLGPWPQFFPRSSDGARRDFDQPLWNRRRWHHAKCHCAGF